MVALLVRPISDTLSRYITFLIQISDMEKLCKESKDYRRKRERDTCIWFSVELEFTGL